MARGGIDLEDVKEALKEGSPVFIFDSEDREGETDVMFWAPKVTPESVALLRNLGGGLVCVVIHPEHAREIDLPFMVDVYEEAGLDILKALWPDDIPYDERSTFSLTVNHRDTFTGVTDEDRALTIRELARFFEEDHDDPVEEFGERFRSPGHVHLLRPFDGLLDERTGHTELSAALLEMCGLEPKVAVICEMLEDGNGAVPPEKARRLAGSLGCPFVTGDDVLEVWKRRRRG